MKKQNVINLVKYHVEKNEEAFISEVAEIAKEFDPEDSIIICLSGRGDKDVAAIARYRGRDLYE